MVNVAPAGSRGLPEAAITSVLGEESENVATGSPDFCTKTPAGGDTAW